MKNLILAALAIVSVSVGAANAQSFSHEAPPHQQGGKQVNSLQRGG
jgi:hypothetical protein